MYPTVQEFVKKFPVKMPYDSLLKFKNLEHQSERSAFHNTLFPNCFLFICATLALRIAKYQLNAFTWSQNTNTDLLT
jgi:hypothetical protein